MNGLDNPKKVFIVLSKTILGQLYQLVILFHAKGANISSQGVKREEISRQDQEETDGWIFRRSREG
jgi:hypothetical protein